MRISYRQSARDDLVRQFRYYLVEQNLPEVAIRFRASVRSAIQVLRRHPLIGPHYPTTNPGLQNLRSWPVSGFEVVRIYYHLASEERIEIVRILHSRRDVERVLEREAGM